MKKRLTYFLSFLIPLIIILLIFTVTRFVFNNNTMAISDNKNQYVPLFNYLKDLLSGNTSLMYNFSKGMGGGMIGTFAYYLSSPLNIIIIFFPKKYLPEAMMLITVIKISLAGLTMFYYLNRNKGKDNYHLLIFSTCYALSAYTINFYFNIMWLDALYLLPLILVGIDKILGGEKSFFYFIFLFLAIITNYYIGYMICIFAVIYLIYKMYLKYPKYNFKVIWPFLKKFAVASLLAGLLTSFLMIPTLIELQSTPKGFDQNFLSFSIFQFNALRPIEFLSRFFIASHNDTDIIVSRLPNLYCSLIIIPLVFFYFFNKEISRKEKISGLVIIIFFLIGFFFQLGTWIWHGLAFPQAFVYRFSFLFIFFLILIAARSFDKIKFVKKEWYLHFYIGYLIIALLIILFKIEQVSIFSVIVSIIVMSIYLMFLSKINYRNKKKIIVTLIILVSLELAFNGIYSLKKYHTLSNFEYRNYIEKVCPKITEDKIFSRVETERTISRNDSLICNSEGITNFLSSTNGNLIKTLRKMGVGTWDLSVSYSRNFNRMVLVDSILGVDKRIVKTETKIGLRQIDMFYSNKNRQNFVYKNDNSLGLGGLVSNESLNFLEYYKQISTNKRFDYQTAILNTMTNSNKKYYTQLPVKEIKKNYYEVELTGGDAYYLDYKQTGKQYEKILVYINDEIITEYRLGFDGVIMIPEEYQNEKIRIRLEYYERGVPVIKEMQVFAFHYDIYQNDIEKIKNNLFNIEEFTENSIKGNVNVSDDFKMLFLSIPYENGWEAYVDGKKVEIIKLYEAFMGIELETGNHTIELKYYSPKFNLGIAISLVTLMVASTYFILENRRNLFRK